MKASFLAAAVLGAVISAGAGAAWASPGGVAVVLQAPFSTGERACLDPAEITSLLAGEGYTAIRVVRLTATAYVAHAFDGDGGDYELRVARCSGEVDASSRAPYRFANSL